MHSWDLVTIPNCIDRSIFVEEIFELGLIYEYGCDVLVAAVQLGDEYVDDKNKYYSIELAHASLVLVTKFSYDDHYSTDNALSITENKYTVLLEWEIFTSYHIKIDNFISFIGRYYKDVLPAIFWDLSKTICSNKSLLNINPVTILCGCLLLLNNNKLKAVREHKERLFRQTIIKLSKEYEIEVNDILSRYINFSKERDFRLI